MKETSVLKILLLMVDHMQEKNTTFLKMTIKTYRNSCGIADEVDIEHKCILNYSLVDEFVPHDLKVNNLAHRNQLLIYRDCH